MLNELLQAILHWIGLHPHWAYAAVFATALLESLAVVGLFLPGTIIMFGIGTVVATGALALGPTLLWAALGALAGDSFSFWLGRHYHQQLRVIWPFRRYPQLINRGVDFFTRHGGKSVLFARFVGPVRPILPAVAGMLDMPARRFVTVNAFSALLWAPAYLLPGVVFGASVGLAAEVAGRLAVLILGLVALLWLLLWLTLHLFRLLQPRITLILGRILDWSRHHPLIRPLAGALLDPDQPEARGLAILGLVLLAASLVFGWLLAHSLAGIDHYVFATLQALRTPWGDRIFVFLTGLGDPRVLALVGLAVLAWLSAGRHWKAAGHWLAALLSVAAVTRLFKLWTAVPRPLPIHGTVNDAFPSSHVSLSLTVYGFLAVLLARELRPSLRWLPYSLAAILVGPIALSRLYLGAHWLSDVLGGLALGLAWVALFGIAYRRHPAEPISRTGLALVSAAALILGAVWHSSRDLDTELARYAMRRPLLTMDLDDWWQQGWQQLPAYRLDLADRRTHPLDVQYAGDLRLLRRALEARGWHAPGSVGIATIMQWLSPSARARDLPVLPQVHDGLHESLDLVQDLPDPDHLRILRLWPAPVQLRPTGYRLWIGNVSRLRVRRMAGLIGFLQTEPAFDRPLERFAQALAPHFRVRRAQRPAATSPPVRWSGTTLLLQANSGTHGVRHPRAAPATDPAPAGPGSGPR